MSKTVCIPFSLSPIAAGFSSAADEHIESCLDLNELCIKHPAATFFVRVEGESMREAGIRSGDILVVDRALAPTDGKIVVACINGEFTVKRLSLRGKKVTLQAANPRYADIAIDGESDFRVWGVVTYVIHPC